MNTGACEIIPGLWLGNIEDSKIKEFINAIDIVINCSKDIPFLTNETKNIRIPIEDNLEKKEIQNLFTSLPKVTSYIHAGLRNNCQIFVHCHAGKQRSASVIVAYLIRYLNISLQRATLLVKSKREIIFTPYMNFGAALKKFEKEYKNDEK
tara:strand:- start:786 stop:1238 length:453 start_codon:yes stop_codon:yes gene_type:complete